MPSCLSTWTPTEKGGPSPGVVPLGLKGPFDKVCGGYRALRAYVGATLGYPSWGHDLRGTTIDPVSIRASSPKIEKTSGLLMAGIHPA